MKVKLGISLHITIWFGNMGLKKALKLRDIILTIYK